MGNNLNVASAFSGAENATETPLSTFISQNARVSEPHKQDARKPCTLFTEPYYNDWIESIKDAFVPREEFFSILHDSKSVPRICGAWVGVLPKLVQSPQFHHNHALSQSIKALFFCVKLKPYAASIQAYTTAIKAVEMTIKLPKHLVNTAEVTAAIMCLTLSEVFSKCPINYISMLIP